MKNIIIVGVVILLPFITFAQWDDCPYGKTGGSGEYPGECGRYIDTDNNKVCDHSQVAPVREQDVTSPTKKVSVATVTTSTNNLANTTQGVKEEKEKRKYPLITIAIVITILYSFTYTLVKIKKIRLITHRKIWNIILTIAFTATSIFSVMLIMRFNSGKTTAQPFDVLYWHVVTGIVMLVISLFHIGWHWRYYKNIFK